MKNADNEMYETPSMREPFMESLSKNTFDELADWCEWWLCREIKAIPLYRVISVAPANATIVPNILAWELSFEICNFSILKNKI